MERKLEYIIEGRNGYVVYSDELDDLRFFFEYGGGNCVAIISVPASSEWTNNTNRSSIERDSILNFVAEQVIRDQVPNGYYKLSDKWIEIFVQ